MKWNLSLALGILALASACSKGRLQSGSIAVPAAQAEQSHLNATSGSTDVPIRIQQENGANSAVIMQPAQVTPPTDFEVGDHANIPQEAFTIGGRAQRVRFLIANNVQGEKLLAGSPETQNMSSDDNKGSVGGIMCSANSSLFGFITHSPVELGYARMSYDSTYDGLAVNPDLVMCASLALGRLKSVAPQQSETFQSWQIDNVNILIKPVQHQHEAEIKLAIDENLKTLNFMVSLFTRDGSCFAPSEEALTAALDIAKQRIDH